MQVTLITPFMPIARNGNAHTAVRWRRFLRQGGHQVAMDLVWDGKPADLMIALHARRSHGEILRFVEHYPDRPVVLVLTGTDIYRDIQHDVDAQASLSMAARIVVLQEQGPLELAPRLRPKARVVYQSSPRLQPAKHPIRTFDVCVVAHLRAEKDPFRAALAAQLLPTDSRIRIDHVGGPLQAGMAEQAALLAASDTRWRWLGALTHGATRRRIARSHLLVLSSRMEGGANVIPD